MSEQVKQKENKNKQYNELTEEEETVGMKERDVCRYGEAWLQNMTISFHMDIYDADVKIAMGTTYWIY